MRKNCEQALGAWRKGKALRPAKSIWTDGDTIFSYGTALVTKWGERTVLNRTRYSVTTTIHQNALAVELDAEEVDGVPWGAGPYELGVAGTYELGA